MKKIMENWKRHVEEETELKEYEEESAYPETRFTPEQQAVIDAAELLHDAMEEIIENPDKNPDGNLTDTWMHLLKGMKSTGLNIEELAKWA